MLAELTAVMSLLEGHADVVMDGVGPQRRPVGRPTSGQRFQRRREEPGRVEAALRRLLGSTPSCGSTATGAAFVRAVVDRVGMPGFNRVWKSRGDPAVGGRARRPGPLGARGSGTGHTGRDAGGGAR